MSIETIYSITGQVMIKNTESGRSWVSLVEDNDFRLAIASLYDFVIENNADTDTAYNWVCDQAGISTFVSDTPAWDMFYAVYTQAAPIPYFQCAHA